MIDQSFSGYLFGSGLKQMVTEANSDESNSYELCHLLSYMIHRVPHKNDGTRKMWMNDQGTQE